ncbi:type II secretion system minor pseudopilin GspK [Haliea sp. E1-2-M8]|uniref:type II secretion system minor pseudopilin GspK n=1 Tax=Haliea sp. E1-2-M8 TaxID=3064706 RepID=UPI002721E748|nr:type II secretion system minor pseudopilin GspK [Haliea sp. E1-2-M8]MDO8862211.1 type II secretion system minor pseudopilin GspK [Haliea sp. E1-2-M8]
MHCRLSEPRHPDAQRGVALVVALLVFGLSAALLVAMQSEFTLFYQRGSNLFLAEQGHAYLRGAEELATLVLVTDYDADQSREQPRDDLGEIWAQQATPYPLDEGGWLLGSLQDLQGRFNLNWLATSTADVDESGEDSARFTPAQAFFIRLLQALPEVPLGSQEAIAVTQAIGDWLDPDTITRPLGAEDDFYSGQSPSYRSANRPMASVSELRAVANMTPELYHALAPLVTVWPQTPAPLNVHTAALPLLRAVNGDGELLPLGEVEGESLFQRQRSEGGFVSLEDLLEDPVFTDKNMQGVSSLLGESSAWFLLSAEVEVADRNMRLYSVLHRDGRTVRAVARASGSL